MQVGENPKKVRTSSAVFLFKAIWPIGSIPLLFSSNINKFYSKLDRQFGQTSGA